FEELVSVFPSELNKDLQLLELKFTKGTSQKVILSDAIAKRFNHAIQAYLNLDQYNNTVIWVGQKDYEIAVCRFWQLLTNEQKTNFNFGINFTPSEIPKDRLNFIVIPENLEAKFTSSGFYIIKNNDSLE